jgi:hypothetical protein
MLNGYPGLAVAQPLSCCSKESRLISETVLASILRLEACDDGQGGAGLLHRFCEGGSAYTVESIKKLGIGRCLRLPRTVETGYP